MANERRKRWKYKGRGKEHSFLRLPHYILDSPEFEALSGRAVKLLIDIAKVYRGGNNGDLSIPWTRMGRHGWSSQGTLDRAKQELIESRFIVCTRHGGKHVCSLYAVTWEPIDDCDGKLEVGAESVASNLWRRRES